MDIPVPDKEAIIATLEDQKAALRAYGVQRIGLFGSFLRGLQHEESDVDILVEFVPGMKTSDNYFGLAFFLQDLLGRKVDLVTMQALSPYIGPHILKEVAYASISA